MENLYRTKFEERQIKLSNITRISSTYVTPTHNIDFLGEGELQWEFLALKCSSVPGDHGSTQAKDNELLQLPMHWRCSHALPPALILAFGLERSHAHHSPSAGLNCQGLEPQLHPEQSSGFPLCSYCSLPRVSRQETVVGTELEEMKSLRRTEVSQILGCGYVV